MLVLGRRRSEVVVIEVDGREIEVTVVSTGPLTKLGFTAPADVHIRRAELPKLPTQ